MYRKFTLFFIEIQSKFNSILKLTPEQIRNDVFKITKRKLRLTCNN